MIDFIDVTIPFSHEGDLNNGYKEINIKGKDATRKPYPISICRKNTKIQVVSVYRQHIRIIGNAAKFIQRQNVFGTDDLNALVYKTARLIAKQRNITPTRYDMRAWKKGDYDVHRLDITYNFVLPSQATV